MDSTKNITENSQELNLLQDQKGQTFVEFILLLSIIMLISFAFMSGLNTGIGRYWLSMGKTLMLDVPNSKPLNLR